MDSAGKKECLVSIGVYNGFLNRFNKVTPSCEGYLVDPTTQTVETVTFSVVTKVSNGNHVSRIEDICSIIGASPDQTPTMLQQRIDKNNYIGFFHTHMVNDLRVGNFVRTDDGFYFDTKVLVVHMVKAHHNKWGNKYVEFLVQPEFEPVGAFEFVKIRQCSGCGKQSPDTQLCSGCYRKRYCSTECQLKDWDNHKAICFRRDNSPPK